MMGSMGGGNRFPMKRVWSRTQRLSRDSWRLFVALWNTTTAPPLSQWLLQQRQNPPLNRITGRDVLWQQASEHDNQAAIRLLQWEREVNLLRYYGPSGYLREKKKLALGGSSSNSSNSSSSIVSRWFSLPNAQRLASTLAGRSGAGDSASSSSTTNHATTATAGTPENKEGPTGTNNGTIKEESPEAPPVVAKIPFMITARMRQDLIELGYEPTQIARLIPVHAMLLLEHKVTPEQMTVDLPPLIDKYEAERQRAATEFAARQKQEQELLLLEQQKLEASAAAARETEHVPDTAHSAASTADDKTTALPTIQTASPAESELMVPAPAKLSPAEAVLLEAPFAAEPDSVQGTTWHQVVEILPDDDDNNNNNNSDEDTTITTKATPSITATTNVVGLFLDRQEAEFARSVHEDLAQGRSDRQKKSNNNSHPRPTRPSTFEIRTVVKD